MVIGGTGGVTIITRRVFTVRLSVTFDSDVGDGILMLFHKAADDIVPPDPDRADPKPHLPHARYMMTPLAEAYRRDYDDLCPNVYLRLYPQWGLIEYRTRWTLEEALEMWRREDPRRREPYQEMVDRWAKGHRRK